jgi:fido (protein-threonine AMPylation protein)
MPAPIWGEDALTEGPVVAANVRRLVARLHAEARLRTAPDVAMAHDWHREIYAGISSPPGPHFLGAFRGSAHPDLCAYDDVATHLARLNRGLHQAVSTLDQLIPSGSTPVDIGQVEAVVTLCAVLHGEWVCIHPYANGNGRTARVWANWAALRYALPPFERIKPRPNHLTYQRAAAQSMGRPPDFVGDHTLTTSLFLDLLHTAP